MNSKITIEEIIQKQREYFYTGVTKPVSFRIRQLKILKELIKENEKAISGALFADFKKCEFESFATEIGMVLLDITHTIKHLKKWAKPKRIRPSLANFPSSDSIYFDPYGICLIISPWNYPFQLLVDPLIGAISGGNTIILKPSELTPNTSKLMNEIISGNFKEEYISVVEGGVEETGLLLKQKLDKIFFTGSVAVGRIVMQAAANNLIPVTLELGGKSPCIVDETAKLKLAAKRIVWGKFLNAGQTCIAPDYIYIHKNVQNEFIEHIKQVLKNLYGDDPKLSKDFPRIINERNFNRLSEMINPDKVIIGGETNKDELYIAPTVLNNVSRKDKVMEDEIFGPILPLLTFKNINDVISEINQHPKPLAMYIFSHNKMQVKQLIENTSSGGFCVNETLSHFVNLNLPFGGVGNSGIGNYHGKYSFKCFTHEKSVLRKATWFDMPLRYPPYKRKLGMLKKVFGILQKL
ncbi:MAG: aldehyde dehydrogenase [Bacteroidales bacterium]|nr:aldehyde dehydrogenase [Bacteroidales bacterium]